MFKENFENITKSDSNFYNPLLSDINFNGDCLINKISIPKKVINLYIPDVLRLWLKNLSTGFTLKNCLFLIAN